MIFAHIDDGGAVLGFFDTTLHAVIPEGAIEISEEIWTAWIADTAGQRWDAGAGGLVPYTPPAVLAITALRARRKALAREALDARIAAGMPFGGSTLQIDETSQARMSAAVLLAQYELPAGFAWRMGDNSALPMDGAGMIAMGRQAAEYVAALRGHYWGLVDAIAAATDAAALDAIDLAAGWPAPAES